MAAIVLLWAGVVEDTDTLLGIRHVADPVRGRGWAV
jgi:hypothetical protein